MPHLSRVPLLFIHIPKTGGTTVEWAMRNLDNNIQFLESARIHPSWQKFGHSPQHCTAQELRELGINLRKYQLFTVVRHPYERVVSEYNYQLALPPKWSKIIKVDKSDRLSFDEFLTAFLDRSREAIERFDNHQLSCVDYLANSDGVVDPSIKVVTYSKQKLIKDVAARLVFKNPSEKMKFESASFRKDMFCPTVFPVNALTEEHKKLIQEAFAKDFDHFEFKK